MANAYRRGGADRRSMLFGADLDVGRADEKHPVGSRVRIRKRIRLAVIAETNLAAPLAQVRHRSGSPRDQDQLGCGSRIQ